MGKPTKRFAVQLTQDAIAFLRNTEFWYFVHENKFLLCKSFTEGVPFCHVLAVPNREYTELLDAEFLFPQSFVLYVVVGKNEKSVGFETLQANQST